MAIPHPTTPILTDAQRRRVFLEEQLRQLSRPLLSSPRRLFAYVGGPILMGLWLTFVFWSELRAGDRFNDFPHCGLCNSIAGGLGDRGGRYALLVPHSPSQRRGDGTDD